MGVDGVLIVDEGTDGVEWQAQCLWFAVTGDDVPLVLRVEALELVHRHMADIGHLFEVEVAGYLDGVSRLGNVGFHRADVVFAVVGHDVVHRDEGGHVAPRLAWEVVVDVPVVALSAGAAYCLVDVAGTAVVGGNDEYPVAVDAVQVIEVLDGCLGGTDRVAAFVHEGVDFQLVHPAGGVHELP